MAKPAVLVVASILVAFARVASAQPALPGAAPPPVVPAPAQVAAPEPAPAPVPGPPIPPPPGAPPSAAAAGSTAQVAAAPPPPPEPCPPPEKPESEQGARLTGGVVFMEDLPLGAFGRIELEDYMISRRGFVMGVLLGMEGWGSEAGGGGGLPFAWYFGFQQHQSLFATLGFGVNWAIYDRIHNDGGFGILTPEANATVGLDFEGVRFLADGRAQYRWQWGAPDWVQLKAGLSISVTTDH